MKYGVGGSFGYGYVIYIIPTLVFLDWRPEVNGWSLEFHWLNISLYILRESKNLPKFC